MKKNSSNTLGIFWMLAGSLCFAVMAVATKSVSKNIPAAEVVFIRSALSTVFLCFFLRKNYSGSWLGKKPTILAARGLVGFIALTLYFWCLPRIPLGTAVMLNYTAPIFAIMWTHFFSKEKTPPFVTGVVAFSFVGVYLLTAPQMHMHPLPLLAGLGSGFLAGIVHVLIRQSHREESPFIIIFYFTTISAIGSAALLPFTGILMPSGTDWTWLVLVTVSSLLGQVFLTYSLKEAPVSVVSPFGYVTPVLGMILGWLFWREIPAVSAIMGGVIIIACGVILFRLHSTSNI